MKKIIYRISSIKEATIGAWLYTYYIDFNGSGHFYTVKATSEGFNHMQRMWREAGYEVELADATVLV